jgi:lipopolysaccharide export system permease protein
MSNILTGYLARELFKTTATTVLVLYIIFISNALGRELAEVADGDVPLQALGLVMLSQSVSIISMLLPIGIFFSIIFTLGRMYKDHEIVVMNACGIGYRDFYKPVAIVVLPMLLLSGYFSLVLNAQMQGQALAAIDEGANEHEFSLIKPGQFNQAGGSDWVFYTGLISKDKLELQEIILGQTSPDVTILEVANAGRQKVDDKTGDLFLVLGPGQRIEGVAGQKDLKFLDYEQHGVLIRKKNKIASTHIHSIENNVAALWASSRMSDRVELQWRIAIPMALVTLAIVAVPLSHISPRQGRFGKMGYALLVYIVYLNLLVTTRAQLEAGVVPMVINFWWVHLLLIAFAAVLLYRRNKGSLFRKAEPSV